MSDILNKLRDQRANVWEQAKELADHVADENRSMSGEEETKWVAMNSELDALDSRMKAMIDGEERAASMGAAFDRLEGKTTSRNAPAGATRRAPENKGGSETQSELRSFLRGEAGSAKSYTVAPEGQLNWRALSIGAATAGGDLVPTSFYDRLVQHLIQYSAILQAQPTVLTTQSGENIQVPKTTSHPTGGLVAEGASISAQSGDPAFGQVTLGSYKYGTMVQISRELLEDSGVDIEGYLAMQAGKALGNALGTHLVTGNGSSKPHGVVPNATLGVTGATSVVGVPSADNLIDLFYSVIPPYRASLSCYWVLNDTTVATIRKFKDATGRYIWEPNYQIGQPDTILGKPMVSDYNVASTGLSAASVLFGDFSTYFVRLAGGIRFERSDEYAFDSDLVSFRCLLRGDGNLVDTTGSIKKFVGGVS